MLGLLLLVVGCTDSTASTLPTMAAAAAQSTPASPSAVNAATIPLETLVPTYTPLPTAAVRADTSAELGAAAADQVSPSATPVDFSQVIVELRYEIPALGLDRVLVGDMANRIVFLDKATGRQVEYGSQGGVLLELRQALAAAELEPLPDGCVLCVQLEYQLSLDGIEQAGWSRDEVLLASIENFMAVALGAHFPKDTVAGLRRSATAYAPAHTIAYTTDGSLWSWLAIEPEVAAPIGAVGALQSLSENLDALPLAEMPDDYVVSCQGSPVEWMFVNWGGAARAFNIVCPEFSLTADLLPVYLNLNAAATVKLSLVALERPQAAFSLNQLLSYRRFDGARLDLFYGGLLVAVDVDGSTRFTNTLPASEADGLLSIVLAGELLKPGMSSFSPTATPAPDDTGSAPAHVPSSSLVVRTAAGLYDARWTDMVTDDGLIELDRVLNEMLGLPGSVQAEVTATPTLAAASDQGVEATPTP